MWIDSNTTISPKCNYLNAFRKHFGGTFHNTFDMNLLAETIEILAQNGKTPDDVRWVGNATMKTTWEQFAQVADVKYNSGFGASEVATDLVIVGDDWWMSRGEYDGSEWWDFHCKPTEPLTSFELKAVETSQAEGLGFDVSCGWNSLSDLNGLTID